MILEWKACLHLLLPRWSFFDRLGMSPRLEVCCTDGRWQEIFPLRNQEKSPDRGLQIFLLTQLENLVEVSQSVVPESLVRTASAAWILSWVQGNYGHWEPIRIRVLVREECLVDSWESFEGPRAGWAVAVELPC